MSYGTHTATYTVVDIRKTFENFVADVRMIARKTNKWTQIYVEDICHDIVKLAELKYLDKVDITLLDKNNKAVQAVRYNVAMDGRTMKGDRAGKNYWPDTPDTRLNAIVFYSSSWHRLTEEQKEQIYIDHGFKIDWTNSSIDTSYSHLRADSAQTYGSKGYELSKTNFN
ncbi:hypothetical protein EV198_0646 [Roseivirga ehrenbergii]|uniref:Bacterial HORMA domain-containing protein n=1 Tax=Roseivirga ehrenbergii (strain DSM 102268 / JCM 13514 / KCTC 12282 / NCIMB 14502 / KMM 6017) TaxID=279360 RepID=A0A150X829_ROSEK|nr:hypothetical protein [Roseivirga ehrenbergii]KYG74850.1 hypothetical protein MB14_06505 [Roseivirga ehrenbergii]TCL13814.1 hypothetical protein EV198_0646 [Roseivirga ehrenbergii]